MGTIDIAIVVVKKPKVVVVKKTKESRKELSVPEMSKTKMEKLPFKIPTLLHISIMNPCMLEQTDAGICYRVKPAKTIHKITYDLVKHNNIVKKDAVDIDNDSNSIGKTPSEIENSTAMSSLSDDEHETI